MSDGDAWVDYLCERYEETHPDAGPVPDGCSLCLSTGTCPQCNGAPIGQWDEERLAQGRALRVAVEAAVAELRRFSSFYDSTSWVRERCNHVASDLERALGVPW